MSQLFTFGLAPVALLWSFFVLRIVRWYAIWLVRHLYVPQDRVGTRQNGAEVAIEPA
jgi:hypothetical protein